MRSPVPRTKAQREGTCRSLEIRRGRKADWTPRHYLRVASVREAIQRRFEATEPFSSTGRRKQAAVMFDCILDLTSDADRIWRALAYGNLVSFATFPATLTALKSCTRSRSLFMRNWAGVTVWLTSKTTSAFSQSARGGLEGQRVFIVGSGKCASGASERTLRAGPTIIWGCFSVTRRP